jgi:hypothetical protein
MKASALAFFLLGSANIKLFTGFMRENAPVSANFHGSPPETLQTIEFCAEKCRFIPEMCTHNLHRGNLKPPAPKCLQYSLTVADDIYFKPSDQTIVTDRNKRTVQLVSWAAARARESRKLNRYSDTHKCEDVPTNYSAPMMWPEELYVLLLFFY